MSGNGEQGEMHRLIEMLESRSEDYIARLIAESHHRSERTIRAMAQIMAAACIFLIAAMCFVMAHVQRNTDVVAQVSALADSDRRWINALKTDQDLQVRRYQLLTTEIARLRAAIKERKGWR